MNFSSRRAFLKRSGLVGAGVLFSGPLVGAARALSAGGEGKYLEARAFYSMSTVIEVVAVGERREKLPTACEAAFRECGKVDRAMNFYGPQSELTRLNELAATGKWIEVSPPLLAVLREAKKVYEDSEGAFDPTVGSSVLLFRSARQKNEWPSEEEIEKSRKGLRFFSVEIDEPNRRVRFGNKGTLLDLSGIAKGYAVDEAVRAMREAGASGGIVNAGGNLFVFGPAIEKLPPVSIQDPFDPEKNLRTLAILEEGLATSGDYEQGVLVQGRPCSHLLDPATGRPCESGIGSASARAQTAMRADAWSSALYIRPELARKRAVASFLVLAPAKTLASSGF
ncbi:MAG: FAD:protein FMN transferase [Bdellovibrionota bacterium]